MREFTEGSYLMFSLDFFCRKSSSKFDFLEIYEIFNVTSGTNLGFAKCD